MLVLHIFMVLDNIFASAPRDLYPIGFLPAERLAAPLYLYTSFILRLLTSRLTLLVELLFCSRNLSIGPSGTSARSCSRTRTTTLASLTGPSNRMRVLHLLVTTRGLGLSIRMRPSNPITKPLLELLPTRRPCQLM